MKLFMSINLKFVNVGSLWVSNLTLAVIKKTNCFADYHVSSIHFNAMEQMFYEQLIFQWGVSQMIQMRSENCDGISIVPVALQFSLLDTKVDLSKKLFHNEVGK